MSDREKELTEKIAAGNSDAMADYIQMRRGDLLAVILNKMGPALRRRIEADDILQEVASTAVTSMKDLDFTERGPFGWLCEITQRKIIDAERRFSSQKRGAHREVGIHGSPDQSQIGIANLLIASITSPSRAFSRNEKEFLLLDALDKMPDEQCRVLQMRYRDGLTPRDIAKQIGKTDGATRVLLTRALQKLREMVGED